MNKRAQAGIEYMMTYGWAILAILVVSIAVWQLGFFDISKNVQRDKRGFSQITPLDFSLKSNGDLSMVLQNNAGTLINLRDDNDGTAANLMSGGSGACTLESGLPYADFRPAALHVINFTTCPIDNTMEIGDYYKVNVTISYENPSSGLPHLSNGVVWGPLD